jgi:hypothetical protein
MRIEQLFSIINSSQIPGDVTKKDLYITVRAIISFRRDLGLKNDVYAIYKCPDIVNYLIDDIVDIDIHMNIIYQIPEIEEYIDVCKDEDEDEDESDEDEDEEDNSSFELCVNGNKIPVQANNSSINLNVNVLSGLTLGLAIYTALVSTFNLVYQIIKTK